jgi:excisionase family DNA binding protein
VGQTRWLSVGNWTIAFRHRLSLEATEMTSQREDGDQLELWPTEPIDAEEQRHESRSRSPRTPPRLSRQRTIARLEEPADPPHPWATSVPATANNDGEHLWSIADVARYLAVSKDTIYGWRKTGYGPPASKVGKHLRWRSEDVTQWVELLRQTEPSATE